MNEHIAKIIVLTWFYGGIIIYIIEEMFVQEYQPPFTFIATIVLWPFFHTVLYAKLFWWWITKKKP